MKSKYARFLTRLISVVLVIALFMGTLVYKNTSISLSPERMTTRPAVYAAEALLLGNTYAEASRLERVGMYLQLLLGRKNTYDDYMNAADVYTAMGRYEDATDMLLLAVMNAGGRGTGEAYLKCGYLYALTGDYDNALEYIAAGAKSADSAYPYMVMAMIQTERNDSGTAAEQLSKYLEKVPDSELESEAGAIAVKNGSYSIAAGIYTRLYEKTGDTDYLLLRAYSYLKDGRTDKAFADCDAYVEQDGIDCAAQLMPAIICYRDRDYAAARNWFETALTGRGADRKRILFYMTLCSYRLEDYEAAVRYADEYLLAPDAAPEAGVVTVDLSAASDAELYRYASNAGMYTGDYAKAAAYCERYLALSPGNRDMLYRLAACEMAQGEFGKALEHLDSIAEPDEAVNYSRALCLYNTGRGTEAAPLLAAIIKESPDSERRALCEAILLDIETKVTEE